MRRFNPNCVAQREFWEARGQWYPTWQNGTTDDNALQVDYIRVYAATVTNEKGELFNVGGVDGRYYWQENCTFDDGEIVRLEEVVNVKQRIEICADSCWNAKQECNIFSIENENCNLRNASMLPNRNINGQSSICGYIPSRFKTSQSSSSDWNFVAIPCVFIFLIITAVLLYRYKVFV